MLIFTGLDPPESLQEITLHVCYRLSWKGFLARRIERRTQLVLRLLPTLTCHTLYGTPICCLQSSEPYWSC